MNDRYSRILGLDKHQPKTNYVCFLPWVSEFGWYIMNHIKRFHGYNHNNKIAVIKHGHECLFPSATELFYDWIDTIPDKNKGGIVKFNNNEEIKTRIVEKYGKSIHFVYPEETSWEEKKTLAHITFIPKPLTDNNLKVDIVITPRYRSIEPTRNYRGWQKLTNTFVERGWTVGVCGKKELSMPLTKIKHYAHDYVDVDSDIEMMLKSKLVVSQDTGLAYLGFMCKKPTMIVDKPSSSIMDLHRDKGIWFRKLPYAWNNIMPTMIEIEKLLK